MHILGIYVEDPNTTTRIEKISSRDFFRSEITFIPARPIHVQDQIVPEQIKCEFLIQSLGARVRSIWKVEISLIFENEIPQTKRLSISVEGKSPIGNIPFADRVEKSNLDFTSDNIRELEVLAVQVVIRRWEFNASKKSWREQSKNELSQKEISALRRELQKRTAYRSLDPQFLKEIAQLFMEAERKGERTNIYVADVIGRREGRIRTSKTAEKWISECRRQGYLAPSTRNKARQPKKGKTK